MGSGQLVSIPNRKYFDTDFVGSELGKMLGRFLDGYPENWAATHTSLLTPRQEAGCRPTESGWMTGVCSDQHGVLLGKTQSPLSTGSGHGTVTNLVGPAELSRRVLCVARRYQVTVRPLVFLEQLALPGNVGQRSLVPKLPRVSSYARVPASPSVLCYPLFKSSRATNVDDTAIGTAKFVYASCGRSGF